MKKKTNRKANTAQPAPMKARVMWAHYTGNVYPVGISGGKVRPV